jgi:hypothetical protein
MKTFLSRIVRRTKPTSSAEDLLGPALRVMSAGMKIDFDFESFARKNIFNRLSRSSEYGFFYWPYGYLFRHVRWGGVNSLGFRIEDELEDVKAKHSSVYRIAFLGGSTGFDVLVPSEQTLVFHLESLLNTRRDLFGGKPVKIFNLSLPGNLVLNQIVNYVQFGWMIDPDMVICHSAANDLCTMQMNDPAMVRKYKIGYPDVLEAWGKKIHNAASVDIDYQFSDHSDPNFRPAKDRNGPVAIIDAYTHRIKQFSNLVRAGETQARFIVGFQPWITSKSELHPEEIIVRSSYNPYYQKIYKNVESMYSELSADIVSRLNGIDLANIHEHFRALDGSLRHFGDTHHLLGAGNREAALCYFNKIVETISKSR